MNPKDIVSRLREKYSKQHARMLYVNSDECYEKSQKLKSNYYKSSSPVPIINGEMKSRINELRMENKVNTTKRDRKSIVIIEHPSNNGFILLNKRKMSKSPLSQEITK